MARRCPGLGEELEAVEACHDQVEQDSGDGASIEGRQRLARVREADRLEAEVLDDRRGELERTGVVVDDHHGRSTVGPQAGRAAEAQECARVERFDQDVVNGECSSRGLADDGDQHHRRPGMTRVGPDRAHEVQAIHVG